MVTLSGGQVTRVLFPVLPGRGNAITPPAPGDHKGLVKIPRIFLAPHPPNRPRPYGSSSLLAIFQPDLLLATGMHKHDFPNNLS